MNLTIPLGIDSKGFLREERLEKSIDESLALLLSTSCFSSAADPLYGFIFNNLRFEIFNENEGVVYNSSNSPDIFEGPGGLYNKKITGSSKSLNTFAAELREAVMKNEKRLTDIGTSMTYIREERKIYVTIKGVITATGQEYQYKTIIKTKR